MFEAQREKLLSFRQVAQRIRVPAGFLLAPLLLVSARSTIGSMVAGAALAVVGLAIRAWASGHLKKNMELATAGPYAHTRNPLYLGTFLLGTGIAISGGAIWFVALFVALYLFIYFPVMMAEADTMRQLFPDQYEDYIRNVPMFIPRITPYRANVQLDGSAQDEEPESRTKRRFEAALYLRHREYRAALGTLAVYALLAAKLLLIR